LSFGSKPFVLYLENRYINKKSMSYSLTWRESKSCLAGWKLYSQW